MAIPNYEALAEERIAEFKRDTWYQTRPKCVQDAIDQYPIVYMYRHTKTNQNVYLYSYFEAEPVTECSVIVERKYNPQQKKWPSEEDRYRVFGVPLHDLECLYMLPEQYDER